MGGGGASVSSLCRVCPAYKRRWPGTQPGAQNSRERPWTVWLSQLEREGWKKKCGDLPLSHCPQGLAGILPAPPGVTKVPIPIPAPTSSL